jgi:hypothetical protein
MRALALHDFGAAPGVRELPVPEPGPGDVLVRVKASSLNGYDVMVASGALKEMMEHRFPVVLGKDYAGMVEAVGDGVTSVMPGDEVFGTLMRDYVGPGTFAEFVVVSEAIGLTRIPSGLDLSRAGALGLAGTAAHTSIEAVSPSQGETVLISGATGGVGSMAIQFAVARGAEVIATAKSEEGAEFVKGLGGAPRHRLHRRDGGSSTCDRGGGRRRCDSSRRRRTGTGRARFRRRSFRLHVGRGTRSSIGQEHSGHRRSRNADGRGARSAGRRGSGRAVAGARALHLRARRSSAGDRRFLEGDGWETGRKDFLIEIPGTISGIPRPA